MERLRSATRAEARNLQKIHRRNLRVFREQPLREISGAFGDLGTLLPILIALAKNHSTSLSSTLVFSGLANILTGVFFGIPLPVQPMKAIAAVAIARRFTLRETTSAGIFVAAVIAFLSITGLIQWVTRKIPIPVIKGIQVGTGLSLITSSGALLSGDNLYENDLTRLWVVLAIALLVYSQVNQKVPYTLIILLVCMCAILPYTLYDFSSPNLWNPTVYIPSPTQFSKGALDAGLGQIPLTTLNSVIAVTYLAADLLPEVSTPSVTAVGLSVAGANLVACWFGSMPICHGSGGLAAQYRFGARSGSSVVFLGLIKLILGLFLSKITLDFFEAFPKTQLGILVFVAGIELARVGESLNTAGARDLWEDAERSSEHPTEDIHEGKTLRDLSEDEGKRRWLIMSVTIGGILAFRNDAVGFLAGMLCYYAYKWHDWWIRRRCEREGRIRLPNERSEGDGEATTRLST
ncbi:hypothetical protein MMC20_002408 [Loxospora ochrophaea]|nr:hypothetical protein [Loxospora ochrophaea]